MEILYYIAIGVAGILLAFAILILAAPFYARFLANDPANPGKSHAFTTCAPNQAKAIMRGETLVRFIMNNKDHRFEGQNSFKNSDGNNDLSTQCEIQKQNSDDWERAGIVRDPDRKFGLARALLDVFKAYTYKWSGYIFTGIPGFQRVYTYELPRTEMDKDHNVFSVSDTTDHVIILDDTWYVKMDGIETADSVPMNVVLSVQVRITNPYLALFGNEKWYEVLDSSIRSHLIDIFKLHPSERFVGGLKYENEEEFKDLFAEHEAVNTKEILKGIADELRGIVEELTGSQGTHSEKQFGLKDKYGIDIGVVQILDVEPPKELAEMLFKPVEARRRGQATLLDGVAKSKALNEIIQVVENGGEVGKLVQQYEAQIATADDSKSVFITGNGNGGSNETTLLLQQLHSLGVTVDELKQSLSKGGN